MLPSGAEAHVPFRVIAKRLGMSLGSVQKSVRRHQRRQAELEEVEPQEPWSRLSPQQRAELDLAEVLADLRKDGNNELARYRLRHTPIDTPGHPWA
jgi:IS30 family transposase